MHTLKGDSAACGLRELSELAHQFEDALSLEEAQSDAAVAEIAFAAADIFAEMIAAYHKNTRLPDPGAEQDPGSDRGPQEKQNAHRERKEDGCKIAKGKLRPRKPPHRSHRQQELATPAASGKAPGKAPASGPNTKSWP